MLSHVGAGRSGRYLAAMALFGAFASCQKKAERQPIVSVFRPGKGGTAGSGGDAAGHGGSADASGKGGRGGKGGTGGAGGTAASDASGSGGDDATGVAASGNESAGEAGTQSSGARGGTGSSGTNAGGRGGSSTGGVGGSSTAGVGGTTSGAGEAGSTSVVGGVPDDCQHDTDCPGGHCVALSTGFRTCQSPTAEATMCSGSSADDCCTTSDCQPGKVCFSSADFPYPPTTPAFNVCTSDTCQADQDCLNDEVCVPAGVLGRPIAWCFSGTCRKNADCTEFPDGRCVPVTDECDGVYWYFGCSYPAADPCRTNADCGSDQPPFGPGAHFCHLGSCEEVLSGTVCDQ